MPSSETFIEERLKSLQEIDVSIVSLLSSASELFAGMANTNDECSLESKKEVFILKTSAIYETLSKVAKGLRSEVKIMDDNIGVFDRNKDGVMILPIPVDQNNTRLGVEKLQHEITEMKRLLAESSHTIPNDDILSTDSKS